MSAVSPDRPIAYVLGTFPQASQAFITREVRGLIQLGRSPQVFALGRRSPDVLDEVDARWFRDVRFVPRALAPSVLAANVHYLRARPRRYVRACVELLSLPHQPRVFALRALVLFLRAAWIARAIELAGGCRQVHAHFALAQTEVAMAVSRLLGVPCSFTAHARDIYATPSALEQKIRGAALVVTCTQYNVDYLRTLVPDVPAARIQLVHHGVDVDAISKAREGAEHRSDVFDPPLVVAAGRLIDKKGFDTLVDACAELRDRGVPFRCRIFGEGPRQRSLQARVATLTLNELVEFPGWVSSAELTAQMRAASVFAMPSRVSESGDRDGIPNVVLEAMAAGVPVVATDVSGIPEAVDDGVTGFLVGPGSAHELARGLETVLRSPELRVRFGHAARAKIAREFDLRVSSARLAAVFDGHVATAR